MKRILSLILAVSSLTSMAQYPVSSISITLPPQPMPNVGDWAMPFVIAAQARLVQGQVPGNLIESRILVTIKKDGNKFCGNYSQQNAPYSAFNSPTKTWSGGVAINLISTNCEMPPGNYELCVQFFTSSLPVMPLSNEVCKSFTIQDRNSGPANYAPPQNIMPFDGKVFTQQEASIPIMFRWTPVLPKPKGDILYKIKIVEIMPGQSRAQAMLNNVPLAEKELRNETQTSFKLAQRCHDCGMGFLVEAVSADRVQGREPKNYGKSEATGFSIRSTKEQQLTTKNRVLSLLQPVDGTVIKVVDSKKPVNFTFNVNPKPDPKDNIRYDLKVWEIPDGKTAAQVIQNGGTPVIERHGPMMCCVGHQVSLPMNSEGKSFVWTIVEVVENPVEGQAVKQGKLLFNEFTVAKIGKPKDTLPNPKRTPGGCQIDFKILTKECIGYTPDKKPIYRFTGSLQDITTVPDRVLFYNDPYTFNCGNNTLPGCASLSLTDLLKSTSGSITPNGTFPATISKITPDIISWDLIANSITANATFSVFAICKKTEDGSASGSAVGDTTVSLPPCPCNFCDALIKEHFSQAEFNYSDDNNSLQLNQMLNLPTQFKIKQLKAEIITFDWQTDNPECRKCQKDDNQFGVIIDGTLNRGNTILDGTYPDGIPNSHELDFNCLPADGVVLNNGAYVNLNITLPLQTTLSCCQDKFTFCVRYTIITTDCKTCSIVKCYTQVPPRQHKIIINNGGGGN